MAGPRRYAEGTSVSADKSRSDLEALMKAHGATEFAFYTSADRSVIQYRIQERMIRHVVEYPPMELYASKIGRGRGRFTPEQVKRLREDEWKRRWRAMLLITKAKLEMIASGGSTLEREFLADMLLPNGSTVGEAIGPGIIEAYATGKMPPTLLMLGAGSGG